MFRQALALLLFMACSVHYVQAGELVLRGGYHESFEYHDQQYSREDYTVPGGRDRLANVEIRVEGDFNDALGWSVGYTHMSDPWTEKDGGLDMLGFDLEWRFVRW